MFTLFATSIFFTAFGQSDFFGKLVFLALFTLSAISWAVLLYKLWLVRHVKRVSLKVRASVLQRRDQLLQIDVSALPKPHRKEIPSPLAHVLSATATTAAEVLSKNHYFLQKQAEGNAAVYLTEPDMALIEANGAFAISAQKKMLEKNLFILATTVTLAPFLGLLGTVWGILLTFTHLQTGASASSNQFVLGGLSTALATTVLGLVIAIPALIGYNYLKHAVRVLVSEMEEFLTTLLTTIEMQYRKV